MKNSIGRRGFLKLIGIVAVAAQIPVDLTIRAKQKIQKYLTFNQMLKEEFPAKLLQEALLKRDHFLSRIKIDDNFPSSQIIIPFSSEDKK